MPHLAPLTWAITPLIFWAILLSLSATLWWSSTPSFPMCMKSEDSLSFTPWNWS